MRKLAIISAALMLSGYLGAQNINQTVQVTNEYETKFADFQKQGVEMAVPDSLYEFDYDFDYSVFETPYKGSYEFTPYRVQFTPQARSYDGRKFYLKAGAGYSFHPELDLVYTPVDKGDFAMSIFNSGRGYSGPEFHDFSDNLGLGGMLVGKNVTLEFETGYDGIFSGTPTSAMSYNSAYASLGLSSARDAESYFIYDLNMDYRYSHDSYAGIGASEHFIAFGGNVGPVIDAAFSFYLDFDFELLSKGSGMAVLAPHLAYNWGIFNLDAGVRLDYLMNSSGKFAISPAVKASADLLGGSMKAILGLEGGRSLNSYHKLKTFNHFYSGAVLAPMASREKFNAYLGLKGHIGSGFQYELKGGYRTASSVAMDAMYGVAFADLSQAYASAEMKWFTERVDFDAELHYSHSVLSNTQKAFAPSDLRAELEFSYNWLKRIYAGTFLEFASARKSPVLPDVIPAYADLGIAGELRLSQSFSVWAKAGNLLCMSIQRVPGYVEKGPYITLGIGLSF